MRRLTGLAFAAAMLAAAAMQAGPAMLAPPAAAAEMSPLQVEARDAIRAWIGAVASGDPAKLDALLAPEFQVVRADGSTYDRAGYLASQLPIIAEVPEIENLVVTSTGDIVVTSYVIDVNMTRDGKVVEAYAPRMTVFRRSGGVWLVIAHGNFAGLEQ